MNLFEEDTKLDVLLSVYMSAPLHAHLRPILCHLGARAGNQLDRLASSTNKRLHELHDRRGRGLDIQTIEKYPD